MNTPPTPTAWRGWGLAAYATGGFYAGIVGWALFAVPFQLSDNVANMLQVQASPLWDLVWANLVGGAGYQRPLLWGLLKVMFDAAGGHYFIVFRAFQALQLLAAALLFVRLLSVSSPAAFAVAPIGVLMLLGFPTFRGLVIEAFPINTYLTIAVCALAALNLTISRSSRVVDVGAVVLFVFALLTVENGILLWPCYVVGRLVGFKGISWRGVAGASVCVAAYLGYRFLFMAAAVPSLTERPSGYLLRVLEPSELVSRFSEHPATFYAYNVMTSIPAVLFAEPRRGVFHLVSQWLAGGFWPGTVLTVAVVTLTTLVMLAALASRVKSWRPAGLSRADRFVLVFLAVLAANAVITFPYQKDEIMSVAGVLYAVAATVSLQAVAAACAEKRRALMPVAASILMLALGAGWSYRYLDLLYHLNLAGVRNQADWVFVDKWKRANNIGDDPLILTLREEMLAMPVPNAFAYRSWSRYSDTE